MSDLSTIRALTKAAGLELTGPFLTYGNSGAVGYKVRDKETQHDGVRTAEGIQVPSIWTIQDKNTKHASTRDGSHHLLKATFSILPHECGHKRLVEEKTKAAIAAVKLMVLTGFERVRVEQPAASAQEAAHAD